MIKKSAVLIFTVLLLIIFLTIIVKCQKRNQTKSKNGINLRNIRNKNIINSNNKNKRNGINVNRVGKNKRTKKIKGRGKNNNNNNGGNNGNTNSGNNYNDNGFLSIQNRDIVYKRKKVFISGVNILFKNFGKDFGNGAYAVVKTQFESWLKQIADAGGNSVRVLIHGDGNTSPKLDGQGYPTGEDTASIIQELSQFLDIAESYNVFVFITLWTGYLNMTANILDIIKNDAKLDRYTEKVIKPLVSGLKTKKALGAYEVIITPQGSVMSNIVDSNPCFDTRNLIHSKATFTSNNQTMKDILKFVNKQLDAIKTADPKALRSLISKEEEASEFCDWCYNYWQDKCLIAAGGKSNGIIDFYSLDAIAFSGYDYYWSPIKKKSSDFKLNKPIIIATTSGICGDSKSITTNFNHAYNTGYAGVFGWRYSPGFINCSDTPDQCDNGLKAVKNYDNVKINMK